MTLRFHACIRNLLSCICILCGGILFLSISSDFGGETKIMDSTLRRKPQNYIDDDKFILRNSTYSKIGKEGPALDLGSGYSALGSDVLITVKTTLKYHTTRVQDILDTWFRLAPEQIYFVTDTYDQKLEAITNGRFVFAACPPGHHRQALCCKQAVEFETYLNSNRSWFCHFDDDNYVNVPQLMRMLSQYNPSEDWYMGKPSTKGPVETIDRDANMETASFWFATGGAGFCISKAMALKMRPWMILGNFEQLCERIRLPDDVTIGFVIGYFLRKNLTVVSGFHSHLESMHSISPVQLHEQISLSSGGGYTDKIDDNLVAVDEYFPLEDDPRRFKSLHCHLFPMASICRLHTGKGVS